MNIRVYLYEIKLLDPLFYAREGLAASYTVPYLHATAVNLAVKHSLNLDPDQQPYLVKNRPVPKDNPRYANSCVCELFYFTPARLVTPLKYFPEITKGENDGYIFRTKQGEPFQAGLLNYIAPESIFQGFIIEKNPINWPKIIRLGSFRGKAELRIKRLEIIFPIKNITVVSHPVDPLVTTVKRGIAINMFPYPIIENPQCSHGVITAEGYRVAFPDDWSTPQISEIKGGKSSIII